METKVCTCCGIEKPIEEFPWKNMFTGKRHARCKTCTAELSGAWYEENKEHHVQNVRENTKKAKDLAREFIYQYLLIHPCTNCGEKDPAVLEFHHVGEKDKEIGRMIAQGYGVEALAAEISRCVVLCANCHRRLTAEEKGWYKWRK
jgi:hypothetical protein